MKRSGSADLPLHYGYVPKWLAERMAKLGLAIAESIIAEHVDDEMIKIETNVEIEIELRKGLLEFMVPDKEGVI